MRPSGVRLKGQAHLLEVDDGVDRLLAHDLGGVLVDQVVAALDRVEGVPFPVVLFDVGQRGAHAALGRPGVRARGVELGQHGGAGASARLEGGAHPGAPGSHDDDVVAVDLHLLPQLMLGSNVKITSVPSAIVKTVATASAAFSQNRVWSRSE